MAAVNHPLSSISRAEPEIIATATLAVETAGQGFTEITRDAERFIAEAAAKDGALQIFMRLLRRGWSSRKMPIRTSVPTFARRWSGSRPPMSAGATTWKGPTTCRRMSRPC